MAKPFRSRAKVKEYYEEASGSGRIGRKPAARHKTLEQYNRDLGLDRGIPSDPYPAPPERGLSRPEGKNVIPENVLPPYASPTDDFSGFRNLDREENIAVEDFINKKKRKQNTGPSVYKK